MPAVASRRRTRARTRPTGRTRTHALVAAAQPIAEINSARLKKIGEVRDHRRPEQWQLEAYEAYCQIGPLRYVMHQKADEVARGRFKVVATRVDLDGIVDPISNVILNDRSADDDRRPGGDVPLDEEGNAVLVEETAEVSPPAVVLEQLRGESGGLETLIRKAALCLDLFGEAYLVGRKTTTSQGQLDWEFFSPLEIVQASTTGDTWRRKVDIHTGNGGAVREEIIDEQGYIARCWEKDPAFSAMPDGPLRSALPLCRQVIALDHLITSATQSKLSAPLLLMPHDEYSEAEAGATAEADFDSAQGGGDDPEREPDDPVILELLEHMQQAIEDPASPTRWVPIVLRLAEELVDKVRVIEVGRNIDSFAAGLREEAYGRLARALDVPPEVMEGKGSTSHWNSWNIDTDFIQKHVLPVGEKIAKFLTHSYLWPILTLPQERGGWGWSRDEAEAYEIKYEPSKLTARSDSAQSSRALYELGLIAGRAVRAANGFDDTDAPDPIEAIRAFMERVFPAAPYQIGPMLFQLYGIELPNAPVPFDPSPWSPEDNSQVQKIAKQVVHAEKAERTHGTPKAIKIDPADGDSGSDEPDRRNRKPKGATGPGSASALAERLAVASHAALERALERAATRIIGNAQRNPVLSERLRGVPKQEVPSALTSQELLSLKLTPDMLLQGAFDDLARQVLGWVRSDINARRNGHGPDPLADDKARQVADLLVQNLRMLALSAFVRPLHEQPNGLKVADEMVAGVLTRV